MPCGKVAIRTKGNAIILFNQRKVKTLLKETGLDAHDERFLDLLSHGLEGGAKPTGAIFTDAFDRSLKTYSELTDVSVTLQRQFLLLAKRAHPWEEYDYPAYAKQQVLAQAKGK